jgi:hypothetical protein
MEAEVVGSMLRLFQSDEPSYQPVWNGKTLRPENGDPQASLENLKKLGLVIQDIWVRGPRVLILFSTGEQYCALGLGKSDALAFVASEAGFGPFDRLRDFIAALPPDYNDKLPDLAASHSADVVARSDVQR